MRKVTGPLLNSRLQYGLHLLFIVGFETSLIHKAVYGCEYFRTFLDKSKGEFRRFFQELFKIIRSLLLDLEFKNLQDRIQHEEVEILNLREVMKETALTQSGFFTDFTGGNGIKAPFF